MRGQFVALVRQLPVLLERNLELLTKSFGNSIKCKGMYAYVKWYPFFMLMSCKIIGENAQLVYKIPIFASIKRLKRQRCDHYCATMIYSFLENKK